MSGLKKRRDKKGRILRTGESQRSDGRYVYVWTDQNHKQNFVYSWKLEPGDRIPPGKRDCLALREKERKIQKDRMDGILTADGRITLLEQVKKYTASRDNVRQNTRTGYAYVISRMEEDQFCAKSIASIRQSDGKEWAKNLKKNYKYSTVKKIVSLAGMALDMAVQDEIIRRNPFQFKLTEAISDDTEAQTAWTAGQRDRFLEFCSQDESVKAYADGFCILFHTGMRISEFCGLTIRDIDFEKNTIRIGRQLLRRSGGGMYIEKTKTVSGMRLLPMTEKVAGCFQRIIDRRRTETTGPEIEGISGFLYLTALGTPAVNGNWDYYFTKARNRYNDCHEEKLPKISPHICRHTYCSLMAANGMNPKVLQYLMGHASIRMTMDVYTHVDIKIAGKEVRRMERCY